MSTFIGTNAAETITPDFVSPTVTVTDSPQFPNDGSDSIAAGGGADTVDAGNGNDTVYLGSGNDLFVWAPGDGSDVVEGDGGTDTMIFSGNGADEVIDLAANADHMRLARNVGAVVMDLHGMERIELQVAAGQDVVTVRDLAGTDTSLVTVDLASVTGGDVGDGQSDLVTAEGSGSDDRITLRVVNGEMRVDGLAAQLRIAHADAGVDRLAVRGLDGHDLIDASRVPVGSMLLTLDGGVGNDTVIGGAGNDLAMLGEGDDRFIWKPGDGSDTILGEAGFDTVACEGSNAAETFAISANGDRALLARDVDAVALDLDAIERIEILARRGADQITVSSLAGTAVDAVAIDLAGAPGADTGDGQTDIVEVAGTNSAGGDDIAIRQEDGLAIVDGLAAMVTLAHADAARDRLVIDGLEGNDRIDASAMPADSVLLILNGGRGNDTAIGGAGDDVILWNPGDGSDTVDGNDGFDTLDFHGSDSAEVVTLSPFAAGARLFRNVASVFQDLTQVERVAYSAAGGTDAFTINDLAGTGIAEIAIDLAAETGGSAPDLATDTVSILGGDGGENVTVGVSAGAVVVSGLAAELRMAHFDAGLDRLAIDAGGGDDTLDAAKLGIGRVVLRLDGGAGNDSITASNGADTVTGGAGDDVVSLRGGDDVFLWNPGDGNDTVNGQGGFDTLVFTGDGADESIEIGVSAGHVVLARDSDGASLDLDNIEWIDLATLGGQDQIRIANLAGSDVDLVTIDLEGSAGSGVGDGARDSVSVSATNGANQIGVAFDGTTTTVSGLAALVTIDHADGGLDALAIAAGGGHDLIDAGEYAAQAMQLSVDAGAGNDTVIGGRGNDTALLGPGNDLFVWSPGGASDTIFGDDGLDTLDFNGSNTSENIALTELGGAVQLSRDVSNVNMLLSAVERIELDLYNGADSLTLNDLTNTAAKEIAIDLEGVEGSGQGDEMLDRLLVNATGLSDQIDVTGAGSMVRMTGLGPVVAIEHADPGFDQLTIAGFGGDDRIDASAMPAPMLRLTLDGGADNDWIAGSSGPDTILGGAGNDTIFGGNGNDLVFAGSGADRFDFSGLNGTDTIDFENGIDRIRITGYGSRLDSFDDLDGAIRLVDGAVQISLDYVIAGAGTIILQASRLADIDSSDFLFG